MVTVHFHGPSLSQTVKMDSLTVVASILAEVTGHVGSKPKAEDMDGTSSCAFTFTKADGSIHKYVVRDAKVADVRAAYDKNYVSKFDPASGKLPEAETPELDYSKIVGRYTVEFADGTYETVRLNVGKSGWGAGKLIAAFLSGPDNDSDYQGFGHVDENGQFRVWARFPGLKGGTKEKAVNIILGSEDERLDAREGYARRSSSCSRCGRTLTVPASLNRGLGPECAQKV